MYVVFASLLSLSISVTLSSLYVRTELHSADPLLVQTGHDGISCVGCHRIAFRTKRYRCTTCPFYNLCHTCYTTNVLGNGMLCSTHTAEHVLQELQPPSAPPPAPPPPESKGQVRAVCWGVFECVRCYVSGFHVTVPISTHASL